MIVPDYGVSPPANSSRRSKKKNFVTRAINKLFFSVFSRKVSRKKVQQEIQRRGSSPTVNDQAFPEIKKVPFFDINSESTAKLIAEHEPDVLFVCGAPILKSQIYGIAKHGAVNFHYGYSPKYKGQHGLLWAFNRADHKNLGGTFLRIDKGVDTGAPISFVFPEINHDDSLEVIEAKVALLGSAHVSQAVELAQQGQTLALPTSDKKRTEYMVRHADYGPFDHLAYYFRRLQNRFLLSGLTLREQQIKTF